MNTEMLITCIINRLPSSLGDSQVHEVLIAVEHGCLMPPPARCVRGPTAIMLRRTWPQCDMEGRHGLGPLTESQCPVIYNPHVRKVAYHLARLILLI